MSEIAFLVKSYLDAIAARDFELARSFLTNRGFRYTSPIATFDDADRFIESLSAIGQILERMNIRRCFVSNNEAVIVLDATITLNGYEDRTAVIFFIFDDASIKSMEVIFDASNYHRMFLTDV